MYLKPEELGMRTKVLATVSLCALSISSFAQINNLLFCPDPSELQFRNGSFIKNSPNVPLLAGSFLQDAEFQRFKGATIKYSVYLICEYYGNFFLRTNTGTPYTRNEIELTATGKYRAEGRSNFDWVNNTCQNKPREDCTFIRIGF